MGTVEERGRDGLQAAPDYRSTVVPKPSEPFAPGDAAFIQRRNQLFQDKHGVIRGLLVIYMGEATAIIAALCRIVSNLPASFPIMERRSATWFGVLGSVILADIFSALIGPWRKA